MKIKIISPTETQTILGDKITISFIVSDFAVGEDGYLYLWFDNPIHEASTAAKITGNFDYTLADISPGPHKLTLEAVRPNHLSFNPPVKQSVSFTTLLPQITTPTLSPAPSKIFLLTDLINWQYVLLVSAVLIIIIGLTIKAKWGKPKIWE